MLQTVLIPVDENDCWPAEQLAAYWTQPTTQGTVYARTDGYISSTDADQLAVIETALVLAYGPKTGPDWPFRELPGGYHVRADLITLVIANAWGYADIQLRKPSGAHWSLMIEVLPSEIATAVNHIGD